MTSAASFQTVLAARGFERGPGGVYRDSPEVRTVCSAGVSRVNSLASVSVGFWLFALPGPAPRSFNQCHVYGGLGAIFPMFSSLRVVAGAKDHLSWRELIDSADEIVQQIDSLATTRDLACAFGEGRLDHCLIRKEARALLS
jgi:hypothetical protein